MSELLEPSRPLAPAAEKTPKLFYAPTPAMLLPIKQSVEIA